MPSMQHQAAGPGDAFLPAINALRGLSRRDFLRFSGAGAAAALAGGASFAALPAGVKFINEAEAAIFTRLAQVVLPVAGSPLVPWTPDGLLQTLDGALLATMAPHILTGLKGGMQYFNDGPVALYKKRFTALDDAEATQFCDAWGNSNLPPQRGLTMGLKKLIQLSYWANPASWEPLGYDGPMTKRLGLKSLGNAPLPTR
ncbi:twin-arginine translocation signal domain-containing protein [Polaromonas sp. JS666]|uniref:twin-arginine translocation signal domain-containing protein n=1 Tax=Polaromonas sp. (strain JS666 / ATCC BAA-500) TaxID=296591 RepID=UPI0000464906|nr:twin-arginine translocation signal domain-containing protein [Polaromonas sp. JS666]ABE46407.1 Twin-arginine translocation pathway signal [Polaromonas sp. JS666]